MSQEWSCTGKDSVLLLQILEGGGLTCISKEEDYRLFPLWPGIGVVQCRVMLPVNTPVHSLDSLYLRRKRGGVKDEGFRRWKVGLSYPTPLSLAAAGRAINDEDRSCVSSPLGSFVSPLPRHILGSDPEEEEEEGRLGQLVTTRLECVRVSIGYK